MRLFLIRTITSIVALILCLITFELFAQLYYYVFLKSKIQKDFESLDTGFIFRKSQNTNTGYELIPNLNVVSKDRVLKTNKLGLRESNDSVHSNKKRIGLIGDSVVFGFMQTQDSTLSAMTQHEIDKNNLNTKIFNIGTPGYSSFQVKHKLYEFNNILKMNQVYYVLNPNDFSVLNTFYEGGDNGLNRFFNPPLLKTPWFVRKLFYRYYRNADANLYNEKWYRWIFNGTKHRVFADIKEMNDFCLKNNIRFCVIPFISGANISNKDYRLKDMHNEILEMLDEAKVERIDILGNYLVEQPNECFDFTDHLTYKGNHIFVSTLFEDILTKQER